MKDNANKDSIIGHLRVWWLKYNSKVFLLQ